MLGPQRQVLIVEVNRVSGVHVDRTHAEPDGMLAVEEIEIDQFLQCLPKRRRVVDAQRFRRAVRSEQSRRDPRNEEARDAERRCGRGAETIEGDSQRIELNRRDQGNARRDPVPKFA